MRVRVTLTDRVLSEGWRDWFKDKSIVIKTKSGNLRAKVDKHPGDRIEVIVWVPEEVEDYRVWSRNLLRKLKNKFQLVSRGPGSFAIGAPSSSWGQLELALQQI